MSKLIAIAAFVFLASCSKSLEENILDEYTKMKDNLCECDNQDCAMRAKAQADAIEQRAREDIKKPSKEIEEKFEKVENQINDCARKHGV